MVQRTGNPAAARRCQLGPLYASSRARRGCGRSPAHLDAPGQGASESDWHLIRVADGAARAAAHHLRVPAEDRAACCDDLRALALVHSVFAAVEVAALAATRGVRPLAHHRRRLDPSNRAALFDCSGRAWSPWATVGATPTCTTWRPCRGRGVTAESPGGRTSVRVADRRRLGSPRPAACWPPSAQTPCKTAKLPSTTIDFNARESGKSDRTESRHAIAQSEGEQASRFSSQVIGHGATSLPTTERGSAMKRRKTTPQRSAWHARRRPRRVAPGEFRSSARQDARTNR